MQKKNFFQSKSRQIDFSAKPLTSNEKLTNFCNFEEKTNGKNLFFFLKKNTEDCV